MSNLKRQLTKYHKTLEKTKARYSALLGKSENIIEHPTRKGFYYARLVDNPNELIVVFNDKVSAIWNLPVLLERDGNRWVVVGRNVDRYADWTTNSAYVPKHHRQHEFSRAQGGGTDVVFVYEDQFTPLLCYPSGTHGSGEVIISPYVLKSNSDWKYVPEQISPNLLAYKPTDNQAKLALIYLNRTTGNPGVLVSPPFSPLLTGTAALVPYIPFPSYTQEPLYFIRLVSGTTSVEWDDMYNARQFIGGGSVASGSFVIISPHDPNSILTTNSAGAATTDPDLRWDSVNNVFSIGAQPPITPADNSIQQANDGTSASHFFWSWGTNVVSYVTGMRARGTIASPEAILKDDGLMRVRGRGWDGGFTNWSTTQAELKLVADEDWGSGSHGARVEIWTTPVGALGLQLAMTVTSDRNIDISGTYNINGVPHTHAGSGMTEYVLIQRQASNSVEGGTNIPNAWTALDINTEVSDDANICSLSSGTFNLSSGTYEGNIFSSFFQTGATLLRLYNITDASETLISDSHYGGNGVRASLSGRFTITSPKIFEIQYLTESEQVDIGLGTSVGVRVASYSDIERYTSAEFRRYP